MIHNSGRSPFVVLWRAFFAQFFTNESVTSDIHLRQSAVWVLAFLLAPGVFFLILLYPQFAGAVIRARVGRGPASNFDDMLVWVTFVLTTYSMVETGFITVLSWDSLTFDCRDAMVLGPLPLRRATIIGAKLAALGTLLFAGSIPINLFNSAVFALETSDQLGSGVLVTHFVAMFAATAGASTFIFAALLMTRGAAALLGGPRLASALGPPLQFVFIVALLCLMILSPAVWQISFVTAAGTDWMPSAWFAGLFEQLRGSPRAFDPEFLTLARRALVATPIVIVGAIILSVVECRRQMGVAAAPSASPGVLGAARVGRRVARALVGRNGVARATADFILLTIARNRAQQMPIATHAAIGVAIAIAALSRNARGLPSLMHPRTVVLWIPLVISYWMAVGLRASFFVPSELASSWTFRANAPESATGYWSAVRASMIAFVVPWTLVITAVTIVPLLGWRVAAWHALVVSLWVILLVEALALSVDFVPFTRAYQPGHAKLKTRWPIYLLGLYLFADLAARLELSMLGQPLSLLRLVVDITAAIAALEVVGRRRAGNWSIEPGEQGEGDLSSLTVLDLSGVLHGA